MKKSKGRKKKVEGKKKNRREDFFDRVFKLVAKIPYGKVSTYGDIAEACGLRSSAINCWLGIKWGKGFRVTLS